jgi:acyl-homoserine-lactone acylase
LKVSPSDDPAQRVEIRRTEHGVPHILADDLEAGFFALGYLQVEDYGARVVRALIGARGEMGRTFGPDSVSGDFRAFLEHGRAAETWHLLHRDTRDAYRGFAEGVNRYVELHPDEFAFDVPRFTGIDAAARDIAGPSFADARRVLQRVQAREAMQEGGSAGGGGAVSQEAALSIPLRPDDGSNAWALGPSRTRSGKAILLRNPHLGWDQGYYEAHMTIPGGLNFYGDFRIGGAFGIIGGFNERLGWATTNNYPDREEVYALAADPERPDHFLWDGASLPLQRQVVQVQVKNGAALATVSEESWNTHLGPVVHRAEGLIYVLKSAGAGEYRVGEQFLRMMQASTLEEWQDAMRIHARGASNLTYADADGNIFYVWNARVPRIPHPHGGDSLAIPAAGPEDVWVEEVRWDELPQVLNPPLGYIHQENDPFHFTDPSNPMDPADFPANFPSPRLRLRSQHGISLIGGPEVFTLEEVVERKHAMGMLLADRLKDDLIAAVAAHPGVGGSEGVREGLDVLRDWDNGVAAESRGGVLFEAWYLSYAEVVGEDSIFAEPWSAERPLETPRGIWDREAAVASFVVAVEEVRSRWGSLDVPWGEVHRVRHGSEDVPVGGCTGAYGCFRVLWFEEDEDGRRQVRGGDGWVFAVEFGDVPRAYSILAYGQSARTESPFHDSQAPLFARNVMKSVAFTEAEIEASSMRRYRPGDLAPAR